MNEANQLYQEKKYSEALKKYTNLLKTNKNDIITLTNIANTKIKLGLYRSSQMEIESILKINDNNSYIKILKIKTLIYLNKTELAKSEGQKYLLEILENHYFDELSDLLFSLNNPVSPKNDEIIEEKEVTKEILSIINQEGTNKITKEEINYVLENTEIESASGNKSIDQLISLGYYLVNTKKYKDAISHFTKLLSKHPTIVAGYIARGTAFIYDNQVEKGIQTRNTRN
jgi:tetratricopeptide (TPR) repeat protein